MAELVGTNFVGRDLITALYVGYFNRAPEPDGLDYWMVRLEAGMSVEQIAAGFTEAADVFDIYPGLNQNPPSASTVKEFVEATYRNFLNREGETGGVTYWVNKIMSGEVQPGNLVLEFLKGAVGNDVLTLQNKVSVATAYTEMAKITGEYDEDFSNELLGGVNHTDASVDAAKTQLIEIVTVEVPGETIEVPGETVYVPGETVYVNVPVPLVHNVEYIEQGSVHLTGTENFAGSELWVGSGIYADGKVIAINHTAGFELAMGANYRTGDQLTGTYEGDGVIRITADAGHQRGGVHNVDVDHVNRSAVSFDYSFNAGTGTIGEEYSLRLKIDINPESDATDFLIVDFANDSVLGSDYWVGYLTNTVPVRTAVIGDEVSYPHLIQESTNFGFDFISNHIIGGVGDAGKGDIPAGEYEVYAQVLDNGGNVVTQVGIIFDLVDYVI